MKPIIRLQKCWGCGTILEIKHKTHSGYCKKCAGIIHNNKRKIKVFDKTKHQRPFKVLKPITLEYAEKLIQEAKNKEVNIINIFKESNIEGEV